MKIAHCNTGVQADVAGDAVVDEDELVKKLGRSAWLVWQILAARRDRNGLTHITNKGIQNAKGFQSVGRSSVLKAIVRLKEAGLVTAIGYKTKRVPRGKRTIVADVYVRKIHGARLLHLVGSTPRMAVPRSTQVWMGTVSGWGGSRSGAGRKSDLARVQRSKRIQEESADRAFKGGPRMSILSKSVKTTRTGSFLPSEEKERAAEAASSTSLVESNEAIGTVIHPGTSRRLTFNIASIGQDVPPYPGYSVVAPAMIPHPPLLKQEMKAGELVTFLMNAYRGALEAVLDVRLPRRKKVTVKARDRKVLLAAAAHIFEHEIPPAVWCWFRIDRYMRAKLPEGSKRPAHPPLAYVFSETALTEKRWQFRAAWGDGKIGGRMIFGKRLHSLLNRYREMYAAIRNGVPRAEAAETFFPGELYDEMVDAAKIEAVETTNKLILKIERGEYVWT